MTDFVPFLAVDLYLYDLAYGLDTNKEDQGKLLQSFCKKFPEHTKLLLKNQPEPKEDYVELLADKRYEEFTYKINNNDYEGYYYPVQLTDTFALRIYLDGKEMPGSYSLAELPSITEELIKRVDDQSGNLGHTWLIRCQIAPTDDYADIAQKIYRLLYPKSEGELPANFVSKFAGGTLWELNGLSPNINVKLEPKSLLDKNSHVWVWIYRNSSCSNQYVKITDSWLRLFCYRHKILWSYGKSLALKKTLKDQFKEIQEYVHNFGRNEAKTEKTAQDQTNKLALTELSKKIDRGNELFAVYTYNLSNLELQEQTIETNLYNYKTRWEIVEQELINFSGDSDLNTALGYFHNYATNKFLRQINKDTKNLAIGLKMLETAVNLIRANVEVIRAERDRIFQTSIGVIGTGLAFGSIVAGLSGQFPHVITPVEIVGTTNLTEYKEKATWPVESIRLTGLSILGGMLIVGIFMLFRKSKR